MDELTLVRELRADAPLGAPTTARDALMDAMTPHRRLSRRWPAAVAAVATIAAGAFALQAGPAASPSTATVLGRAATVAAGQPVPRPRDDQWVFETVYGGATDGGPFQMVPGAGWTRFDGTQYADAPSDHPERLHVQDLVDDPDVASPAEWYDGAARLPHAPAALLAALRDSGLTDAHGASGAARDFAAVLDALGQPVLPADARADLFRALATIPGVTVDDDAEPDLLGDAVLAVTRDGAADPSGVASRRELLLDPDTYAYRGVRVTALKAGRIGGAKGFAVTAGQTWYEDTVTDAVVVDEPGQHR
ncbi:CU044_5270 family protein [Nocardioides conyzicola]|uniref:CU044_5270 family protein n=1 Tax=Nocardioides conyzicola TaxID=1651781 RepID=A0ABP8Y3X7_9ACTN